VEHDRQITAICGCLLFVRRGQFRFRFGTQI
jgi:hypothetical protein